MLPRINSRVNFWAEHLVRAEEKQSNMSNLFVDLEQSGVSPVKSPSLIGRDQQMHDSLKKITGKGPILERLFV